MIRRVWHKVWGHSPKIIVTTTPPEGNVDMEDFGFDLMAYQRARFGALEVSMVCGCGVGAKVVMIGRHIPTEHSGLQQDIAELRRMAGLQ